MIQPRWPTPSWTLKWVGLLLALSIVGLFAISTARAITWTGANLECQLDLSCGELTYAWRPESWRLEGERYPGMPGWSVATYGGQTRYSLWITRGAISSWEFVSVPLWIPFALVAAPTGLLWYRQRAKTKALIDRCQARIAPRKRKKLGLLLVLACCIIHVILAFLCILTMIFFLDSFVQPTVTVAGPNVAVTPSLVPVQIVGFTAACLILGTPVWSILWAWLYVRWMNRLRRRFRSDTCPACGYNLTGLPEPRCPECGGPFEPAGDRDAASQKGQ